MLAQAENRYAQALELAGVMIVGLDPQGRVQLLNREAERVTVTCGMEWWANRSSTLLGVVLPHALAPRTGRRRLGHRRAGRRRARGCRLPSP